MLSSVRFIYICTNWGHIFSPFARLPDQSIARDESATPPRHKVGRLHWPALGATLVQVVPLGVVPVCDAVSRGVDGFAEDVRAKGGASVALGTVVVVKVAVDQRRVGKR